MPQKIISLKNQKEFDAVNRAGKKFVGKFMIVVISGHPSSSSPRSGARGPHDTREVSHLPHEIPEFASESEDDGATTTNHPTRLGLKVGRKFGNAVVRNKFKRRIRAIVYDFSKSQQGHSFIVIPKSYAATADYQALQKDFNKIYAQTK